MILARHQAVAHAFARAAPDYETHAGLQRAVATDFAARIAAAPHPAAPRVLELGCGTGLLTRALRRQLPAASIVATDLAPAMVRQAASARPDPDTCFAVMDGGRPCFGAAGFDLVCASLVFQWFEDLPATMGTLLHLLAPGGMLAFATLGPGSFAEWHEAHRRIGVPVPVHRYPTPEAIAAAWPGAARLHRDELTVAHRTGLDFLRTLRGLGAATPGPGQARLGPGALRRVLACFEAEFGALARYDVIYALLCRP